MNHLLLLPEFTSDATIQQDLYEGAFYLTLVYQQMQTQDTGNLSEKDRLYSWWKISDTTYKGHLPVKFTHNQKANINAYTLEADKVCKFGDVILGVDTMTLPKFSPCKTAIGDILGAMFMNIVNNSPELAYAYLQSAFMVMSTYNTNDIFTSKYKSKGLKTGVFND